MILSEEAYWNIKIISEHGAFPSVFVWVWHRGPGNMHPCISDAWITYWFPPTKCYPHPLKCDINVAISSMCRLKCDENVVISGICRLKGDKNVVIIGMCRLKGDENVVISGIHEQGKPLVWNEAYSGVILVYKIMAYRTLGLCRIASKRSW